MDEILRETVHTAAQQGDKPTLRNHLELSPRSPEVKDHLGRTPLIHTVMANRVDCLALLLKAGARVDNADISGQTALHWAAYKGHSNCVRQLLGAGALWHQTDVDEVTPLHLAAKSSSLKCLQLLLNEVEPGKVDVWDCRKKTALHWSAATVNVEHVRLLLKKGANVNIHDAEGRTPLHWAASCNSPKAAECVRLLLDASSTLIDWQDYDGRTALHLAVTTGTTEVVDLLSQKQKSLDIPDGTFRTPLHLAAMLGLSDKVAILLDRRANPVARDANKATPLHYAASGNHVETASIFLSRSYIRDDAEDGCGRSSFVWAAAAGANGVLKAMAAHGIDLTLVNRFGNSALNVAVFHGHVNTVELLLRQGSAASGNSALVTPLLLACRMGRAKLVPLLMASCGQDLTLEDLHGRTPLHCAADGGQAFVTQILLKLGLNPNVKDHYGQTPLHYSSCHGNCNCMSVLLNHFSCDPNICDNRGETPLHVACRRGKTEAVRLLIRHGAHLNFLSASPLRYTPLDYATLKNQQEVVELLLELGAWSSDVVRHYAALTIQNFFGKHFGKKINTSSSVPPGTTSRVSRIGRIQVRLWQDTNRRKRESTESVEEMLCVRCLCGTRTTAALTIQRAWRRKRERRLQSMHRTALGIFGGETGVQTARSDWLKILSILRAVPTSHPES